MTTTLCNRDHRERPTRGRGMNHCVTARLPPTEQHRLRARKLLATEIAFIPHASFRHGEADTTTMVAIQSLPTATAGNHSPPRTLPPHLARLGATPLLTAEQERDLFRRMNYLKYRANILRAALDPDVPDLDALETAEQLLDEARSILDQIVRANARLVMSVVKKFVSSKYSFDEMLSDGLFSLLKAAEKFDYSRGFRFSTYAHRVLTRNAYRLIAHRTNSDSHCVQWSDEMFDIGDESERSSLDETTWKSLRGAIAGMLSQLDPRERFIVCGRFAFGSQDEERTFQSLADELSLSKERVRQIEQRALVRLRDIALEMGLDRTFESCLLASVPQAMRTA